MPLDSQWRSFGRFGSPWAGLGRPSVRKSDGKHVFLCVFEAGAFENHVFLCAFACLGYHRVPFWSLFGVPLGALGHLGLPWAAQVTSKMLKSRKHLFLCVFVCVFVVFEHLKAALYVTFLLKHTKTRGF